MTDNCEVADQAALPLTREEWRALSRELVNGEEIGRDPRRMSLPELEQLGHGRMNPMKVIRSKCLDCSHTADEVRKCVAADCALWPYRMGSNPFRAPMALSEEERQKRAEWMRQIRSK